MAAVKVFISYSHEDELWKDRLLSHLRVLERLGAADIWDTGILGAGSDWAEEIEKAVRDSDIAVLLISPSFLASDFVASKELPAILERRRRDSLPVVPILVRPSMWSGVPGIAELQFANDPSNPLSLASEGDLDKAFTSIAQRIKRSRGCCCRTLCNTNSRSCIEHPPPRLNKPAQARLFVPHSKEDGDFAELLKLKLEREGYEAWVDTDRLDPGLDWRVEIDQAIKDTTAVLAVMSPEARASEYVTYEWAFAWGHGTKVIPIMLRQTTLHPRLATLQYLDFTNRISRPWSRLFEALSRSADSVAKERER